ncbi:MAG: PAS domain S-box protein [Rhodocyclaceae bacterium]|nr:PAS domain S-box protein [Rhodocyclaceae bacterium]MBX3667371.1 PAS domain S-box protein [Rhodocyclaceae bacterium]
MISDRFGQAPPAHGFEATHRAAKLFDNLSDTRPHPGFRAAIPWCVLAAGVALSFVIAQSAQRLVAEHVHEHFSHASEEMRSVVEHRMAQYESALRSGAALVLASDLVSRDEWHRFSVSLDIAQHFPGLEAVGYNEVVQAPELGRHERGVRAEGFPKYQVHPSGTRAIYIPILYFEPYNRRKEQVLGYDPWTDPARRAAMERAGDTGRPAMSGIVRLTHESQAGDRPGFLIYVPVYRHDLPLASVEQRSAALRGFVAGVFQIEGLMGAMFADRVKDLDVELYDGAQALPEKRFYAARAVDGKVGKFAADAPEMLLPLEIGGRTWTLRLRLRPDAVPAIEAALPPAVGLSCLAASLAFSLFLRTHLRIRLKAGQLAAAMTEELRASEERYRTLVEVAPDAIIVIDERGVIEQINPAGALLFGYRNDELIGRSVSALMPEPHRSAHLSYLARYLAGGKPSLIGTGRDVQAVRKDGSPVSVHVRVGVQRTKGGQIRFVGCVRDLSERLRTEQSLRERRALLRTVIETSKDGFYVADMAGRLLEVNDTYCEQSGYARDELLGMCVADLAVQDGPQQTSAHIDKIVHEGSDLFETRHRRRDGSLWPVEVSVTYFPEHGGRLVVFCRDITERRRSADELRTVLEEAGDFIGIADGQGRLMYVNPAGCKLLDCELAKVLAHTIVDLVAEEAQAGMAAHLDELRRTGRSQRSQWPMRTCSGNIRMVEIVARLLTDGRFLAVGRDLTDKHLVERQLEDERQRLRAFSSSSADWFWEMDGELRFSYFSDNAERILGVKQESMLGRTPRQLATRDGLNGPELIEAHLTRIEQHRAFRDFEYCVREGQGNLCWISVSGIPHFDANGGFKGYRGVAQLITARKAMELELDAHRNELERLVEARTKQLHMAEKRTVSILESAADGIYGVDNEGRFTFVNPAACRMLGYAAAQLIGHTVHAKIHHSHADGRHFPEDQCPIHHRPCIGKPHRLQHDIKWRADGQPLHVALASQPLLSDGQIVGAVVCFTDIHERLEAEAVLQNAKRTAESATRAKSEFLANMSHEIRTPLNGVLGLAQIGYRDSSGRGKAQDTFARILDSGKLLLTIINDILDFSKIEAGKLVVEEEPFDPAKVIEQTVQDVAILATTKSLRLATESTDLPVAVLGDPVRIAQILNNLLSNAIKFTPHGEVKLHASRDGASLVFAVRDTGIGIAPALLERLFQPFEQGDGSVTRKFGGTGLGLVISRRLAGLMGGTLDAESRPGQGSTFTLRLPLKESDRPLPLQQGPGQTGAHRLAGLRLLVAEDNAINQLVLEDLLQGEGAEVVLTDNGQEALDFVSHAARPFHAVLMDVQMPLMDGLEAARHLKQSHPGLPVIGQTAHALKEEMDKCLTAGMVATINKPIDLDTLVHTLLAHVSDVVNPSDGGDTVAPLSPPAESCIPLHSSVGRA